jgi:hypothetical protein
MSTVPSVLDVIETQRHGIRGVVTRVDQKPNGNYSIHYIKITKIVKDKDGNVIYETNLDHAWTTWYPEGLPE